MPLQDVSNDSSVIGWLRQAGHGHLIDENRRLANASSSISPAINSSGGYSSTNVDGYHNSYNQSSSISPPINYSSGYNSSNVHPYHDSYNHSTSISPPIISSGGYSSSHVDPYHDSYNHSSSFSHINNANIQSYQHSTSPVNFASSSAQFLAPHMNEAQLDANIEQMKHDPNTRIIQRPPGGDVVYKQRVFVKYLQPPTPPAGGAIIVREKQPPAPPPDPPLVIRRAPPPPPTPPPVIIRERPPIIPPPEGTTVIDKIIPPGPKPPRQVIVEQFPQLPPKPQDVIVERWLPVAPRQRRIFYERLAAPNLNQPAQARPILIQHGQPNVRIHREITTAPGPQMFHQQQLSPPTDINHILSQIGVNQHFQSPLSPSSLISYDPYSSLQQSYGSIGQSQPNVIVMQSAQPNILSSSSYGLPLSSVLASNSMAGLGMYGSGVSTVPSYGYSSGQTTVYNVPEHIPVDAVLRQFGIDGHSIQNSSSFINSSSSFINPSSSFIYPSSNCINPSSSFVNYSTNPQTAVSHVWNAASHANPPHSIDPLSSVSHVWNAASHANPPHSIDPTSAVSHVWNAASHINPSHSINPTSAVSHVWNAAAHATDHSQLGSSFPGYAGNNNIGSYPYPQSNVQSSWNPVPYQNSFSSPGAFSRSSGGFR